MLCLLAHPIIAGAATHTPDDALELTDLLAGNVMEGGTLAAGDTIILQCGTTYTGNFSTTISGTVGNVITMTASCGVPTAMNVMSAASREAFRTAMEGIAPKIACGGNDGCFALRKNVDYWHVSGIEFHHTLTTNTGGISTLIFVGRTVGAMDPATVTADLPNQITFDRNYLHGTSTGDNSFGFRADGTNVTLTNNYIDDIKGIGQETKCLLVTNGAGPYTVTGNFMRCGAINVMFGGEDPSITNLIPSDITFSGNYLTKKTAWRGVYSNKNIFELKNAQRVTVTGNIMEYSWTDGQTGYAVLFTPANQNGGCTWCAVEDVTFENNIVRHANAGFQLHGSDQDGDPTPKATNIMVRNNLWYDISGANWGGGTPLGRLMQVSQSPDDFSVIHNTIDNDGAQLIGLGNFVVTYQTIPSCTWKDNIQKATTYIAFGDNDGQGQTAFNTYCTGTQSLLNNVVGEPTDGTLLSVPATTDTPLISFLDTQFVNPAAGNYTLVNGSDYKAGGPKDASDNTDVGVNTALLPVEVGANAPARLRMR